MKLYYDQEIVIAQIAATIASGAWSNPEAANGFTLSSSECVDEAFNILNIVQEKVKEKEMEQ